MKKVKTLFLLLFSMAFLSLFTILFLCGSGSGCSNTVTEEVSSPDGELVAVVYKRDCGATTLENTQICLRPKLRKFDPSKQASFFVAETKEPVNVLWTDNRKINIFFSSSSKVFKKEGNAANCVIEYRSK